MCNHNIISTGSVSSVRHRTYHQRTMNTHTHTLTAYHITPSKYTNDLWSLLAVLRTSC